MNQPVQLPGPLPLESVGLCLAPGGAPSPHPTGSPGDILGPFPRDRQLLPRANNCDILGRCPAVSRPQFPLDKSKGLGFLPEALSGSSTLGLSGLAISGSRI